MSLTRNYRSFDNIGKLLGFRNYKFSASRHRWLHGNLHRFRCFYRYLVYFLLNRAQTCEALSLCENIYPKWIWIRNFVCCTERERDSFKWMKLHFCHTLSNVISVWNANFSMEFRTISIEWFVCLTIFFLRAILICEKVFRSCCAPIKSYI